MRPSVSDRQAISPRRLKALTEKGMTNCKSACHALCAILIKYWHNPALRFYIVSVIALAITIAALYGRIGSSWTFATASSFCDSILILLPYWFIRRRRSLTLIPIWICLLFVEANILMYNWNGEILSLRSIFMTGNINRDVTANVPGLIDLCCIIILITTIAYTTYYFLTKSTLKKAILSRKVRRTAVIASFIIVALSQFILQLRSTVISFRRSNRACTCRRFGTTRTRT